ncbi:MAG: xanthine dehydrogenase family protein subunit M [Pseudomonadota bacterium]
MRPFDLQTVADVEAALRQLPVASEPPAPRRQQQAVQFIAGGTNLIDLMKVDVLGPSRLVDINFLPLNSIEPTSNGGLMLGALVSNADTAYHSEVAARYPLLSAAILAGASPQLRNMATNGGNLLQRTRCYYFYDVGTACNKRQPGSGCPARDGVNRIHAILGASEHCIAVHPSDMCVALAALQALVHVQSLRGRRVIPFAEFHRLPGDTPDLDTNLAEDELVLGIELPPNQLAAHSCYLKLRDRASYAFALVSVAAALALDADGAICDLRLALGGVAHRPWRDTTAESKLLGYRPSAELFGALANEVLAGAQGHGHNDFKITMARRAIVRALSNASGLATVEAHA